MCWTDVGSKMWISEWSKDTPTGNVTHDSQQNNYRLAGYGVFALVRGKDITFLNILCLKANVNM